MFAVEGCNKSQFFTILFTTKEEWLKVWNSLGEVGELQAAQVLFLSLYLTSSKVINGLYINPADILVFIFIDLSSFFDTVDNIFILETFFSLSFCNTSLPAFPCFSLAAPSQSVMQAHSPLLSNEMPRGWVVGHFLFPSPKVLISTHSSSLAPSLSSSLVSYLFLLVSQRHITLNMSQTVPPVGFPLWLVLLSFQGRKSEGWESCHLLLYLPKHLSNLFTTLELLWDFSNPCLWSFLATNSFLIAAPLYSL